MVDLLFIFNIFIKILNFWHFTIIAFYIRQYDTLDEYFECCFSLLSILLGMKLDDRFIIYI